MLIFIPCQPSGPRRVPKAVYYTPYIHTVWSAGLIHQPNGNVPISEAEHRKKTIRYVIKPGKSGTSSCLRITESVFLDVLYCSLPCPAHPELITWAITLQDSTPLGNVHILGSNCNAGENNLATVSLMSH